MKNRDSAFNLPIRIIYRPPKKLLYFSIFNHVGAMVCITLTALASVVKLFLIILLLLHFHRVYSELKQAMRNTHARVLCLKQDDSWVLINDDDEIPLRLCPGALVHQMLVVLCFRYQGRGKFRFVLCRDNVNETVLRRLRVRLLHGRAAYSADRGQR